MVDPLTSSIIAEGGKTIVGGVLKSIIKRSENIDKNIEEDFKVLGREMIIQCPESIQQYSLTFESKKHLFSKKKKFRYGNVRRVNLRPFRSLQSLSKVIDYTNDGFEINTKYLNTGEIYLLEIEYKIEDKRFIENLVNKNVARDTPKTESDEYWMVAQLKHLKTLKQDFGYIELRDIDFGVDVSVHQDVKMKVPGIFRNKLETIMKLTKKVGRSEKFRLYQQLLQQQQEEYGGKEFQILKDLQDIFIPMTFRHYVDVQKDFHYNDCERGRDFYDTLPFPTWPKSMKVISRTDLNFDRPAADGLLIYKRKNLIEDLEKIFS